MKIVLGLPSPSDKGYLRRQMAQEVFFNSLRDEEFSWASLIQYILGYVREPEDRDEALEALSDLSKEEYAEIISAIRTENLSVLPKESETSESS